MQGTSFEGSATNASYQFRRHEARALANIREIHHGPRTQGCIATGRLTSCSGRPELSGVQLLKTADMHFYSRIRKVAGLTTRSI